MSTLPYRAFRRVSWSHRSIAGVTFAVIAAGQACAADVSFKQAFAAASKQDVMVITVPEDEVLVVEPGTYLTAGKRLVVVANQMRLEGAARVESFAPGSTPGAKAGTGSAGVNGHPGAPYNCSRSGCPAASGSAGGIGATGDSGAIGSNMLFDVKSLAGTGRLTLVTAGQSGGKGQQGGVGGTGGRGGDGAQISCGPIGDIRANAGDGGSGGSGGAGGSGGSGGRGGAGGTVTLSLPLAQAVTAGQIIVELAPAKGGAGGDPGAPGMQGVGGAMGGGAACGGGGRNGSPGAAGAAGAAGSTGPAGTAGVVRQAVE